MRKRNTIVSAALFGFEIAGRAKMTKTPGTAETAVHRRTVAATRK